MRDIHVYNRKKECFVACALLLCLCSGGLASAQGKWEVVTKEGGVVVSKKEVKDRDLPIFKGVGVINASVLEILAVLDDIPNNAVWMHQCMESRLIKQVSEYERIVYNRTDAPWPVDDRDVVVSSKATVNRDKRYVIVNFKSIKTPLQGEVEDVVRMPTLRGHYMLKILDYNKTRVEYQIDADPGGMLPDWLIEATSEEIPLNTIIKLRKRVMKTSKAGTYKGFVEKYTEKFGFKPE